MSREDNNERKPYSNFRIALDTGMGVLYMVLAGGVIYTRHFGNIELPAGVVYAMSGLLSFYGAFRIYRGIVAWKENKSND